MIPTAIGASALGLALTASTAFIEHSYWLSSVVVNLGTSLLLAFPLAWMGHFLTERIQKSQQATETQISSVRDEVEEVQSDLDQFREATGKTIAELQASYNSSVTAMLNQRADDIENLRSTPSLDLLRSTVEEEMRLGRISSRGFIVPYYSDLLYCRFERDEWNPDGTEIQIFEFGSPKNAPSARASLGKPGSLEELFTELNYDLAAANLLDLRDFDLEAFFGGLTGAIDAIDCCRMLHESIDLGPTLFVPNDGWMITEDALVSRASRYAPLWFSQNYVPEGGLVKHLSPKPWVDYDELWEATSWASYLNLASDEWINGRSG